ncbi:TPA: hypothetical protein ACX6RO_001903 [Photobacterium damselae]
MLTVSGIRSLIGISEFESKDGERFIVITPFVSQAKAISTANTNHILSSMLFRLNDNNSLASIRALRALLSELTTMGYLLAKDLNNVKSVREYENSIGLTVFEPLPLVPIVNRASLTFDQLVPNEWREKIRNYTYIDQSKTDRFPCLNHYSSNRPVVVNPINMDSSIESHPGTMLLQFDDYVLRGDGWMLIKRITDYHLTRLKHYGFANYPNRNRDDYFNLIQLNGTVLNNNNLSGLIQDSLIGVTALINGKVVFQDIKNNHSISALNLNDNIMSDKERAILDLVTINEVRESISSNIFGSDSDFFSEYL